MKVKNIKITKCKLVKLQLIKSKTYKQNSNLLNKTADEYKDLDFIELQLKKALQIIYNYHINNQKIFFVGVPRTVQKKFNKALQKTSHLFIPESTWINGVLSNKVSIFKYIQQRIKTNIKNKSSNSKLKSLFLIKQKPNLIVLFDQNSESNALKEAIKLRIPIISLNGKYLSGSNVLYNIFWNSRFLNKTLSNIFYLLLNSLFKKVK